MNVASLSNTWSDDEDVGGGSSDDDMREDGFDKKLDGWIQDLATPIAVKSEQGVKTEEGTNKKRSLGESKKKSAEAKISSAWTNTDDPVQILSRIPALTRNTILAQPEEQRGTYVDEYIRVQVARLPNELHRRIVLSQETCWQRIQLLAEVINVR